jgi:hypothetical protein
VIAAQATVVTATQAFPTLVAVKEIATLAVDGVPETAGADAKRLEPGTCTSTGAERVPSPNPFGSSM